MSRFRNLSQITLFALLVLGGVLLGLKLFGSQEVRAAHAVAVPASAGHRAPDTLDTQATFTVTNADDGGAGSLRTAMGGANISSGADTIVFDPAFFNTARTINLTGELPGINGPLTITGPGAHLLNIRRDTGGNYRIFTISSGVTATISGLTISNGNAGTGDGGGILNNGTLTITNCHITGNTAVGGGGISNTLGNLLTLTQSTVSNNTATGSSTGGGIASAGGTTITNSTISGNIATGSGGGNGGGIRLSAAGASITSSTITNNSAAGANSAGGLRDNLAPVNIRNSIIAGNVSNATVPDVSFAGAGDLQSGGYNLIGNRGTLTFNGTNDQSGNGAAPLNPQLAPLGIFGGTTPVHALALTSLAFDKGAVDSPIATDQRGFNRRADIPSIPNAPNTGDASDIGAVEMQAVFVANTNDSGTGSLRQLILGAPAGSDIMFDPTVFNTPRTITLTSGEIGFSKNLTVSGPGANLLTVSGNNASRVFNIAGGGLIVTISRLTISNGKAASGAGLLSSSNLSLTGCAIVNNTATAGGGAGAQVGGAVATFTDCTFSGNTASGDGGGVFVGNASGVFAGCTFSGNTSGGNRGGAVSLENSSGSFTNCTVSGNKATFGTGISLFNTSGNQRLAVTNCTITGNTSVGNNGSGLLVEVAAGLTTTATVRNSIIANNSGTDNVRGLLNGVPSPATLISQGFNLTSDNSTTFLNQATDITNANPRLGLLQNNGGPTFTHALLTNSPALDKGSSAGIATDQRGAARGFDTPGIAAATGGDNSDIGAVEMQTVVVDNTGDAGAGSLRAAIIAANASGTGLDDIFFDNTNFSTPSTINLLSALPDITSSVTINGPGANLLTVRRPDSVGDFRIFRIVGGITNGVTIRGLTISGGKAAGVGGGIASDSNLSLAACNIISNAATDGGGGVYVGGAVGTFTDCTFTGNTSGSGGGAVRLITSTGLFSACTFSGNTSANYFGAVSFTDSSGTMTNCTISGNTTTGTGFGSIGLYATTGVRTLDVTSCTIANNTSTSNGGLYVESLGAGTNAAATIRNTIIANNGFNTGGTANPGSFASITSQGFNLTNDLTNGSLNQSTDIVNANPQLGPLQNNGGPTQTRALPLGSPAIDKGNSFGSTTDQRGLKRPFGVAAAASGDGADIGAYESQVIVVLNANDAGAGSLRQAISDAAAGSEIMFDPAFFAVARTVSLTGGEILINTSLTINGPGANLLTLSGNNTNRVFRVASGGLNVSISGVTISNGRSDYGGGIIASSNLTLAACSIINNAASAGGGGVYVAGSVGTFTNCTFSGNTSANYFGAVSFTSSSGTMSNCTISGNATTGTGFGTVGLYTSSGIGTLAISSCTITNNTSTNNGGVYVEALGTGEAGATLRNTIVANNAGINTGTRAASGSFASIVSQGYNLTNDVTNTFLSQTTDITNANPRLGPLQNNGGLTQTHALLTNSPALDKGSSAGIATDQRGLARGFDTPGIAAATGGDNSDIGAVEMQTVVVNNTGDTGAGSLRAAITNANANGAGLDDILFDTTIFSAANTINLLSALPDITSSVTIHGPGANLLTVRRPDSVTEFRIFRIVGGITNGVRISGLTITNGVTGQFAGGGGIVSESNLTLTACDIINNTGVGSGSSGGGVSVNGAVGSFTNCTFRGNRTDGSGGAVRLVSSAIGTFTGCSFSSNTAALGGGAVFLSNASGTIVSCTISGNTSPSGGVYLFNSTGTQTLAITNSTVVNNTGVGTGAGGIRVEVATGLTTTATIRNTIIANNTGPNLSGLLGGVADSTRIISQGFNLTNDNSTTYLNQATDIINANPQLGPLQNNGGQTQTHALLFGSPAIDKGNSSGVATDQRGVGRPVDDLLLANATGGNGADIGAFERTAPAVVSAASFKGNPFAQESIVAMFGENLTGGIAVASTVPLPITLDSTSVMVSDSASVGRVAGLFFVSPGQLNFQIPPGTATGAATVSVVRNGTVVASTSVTIVAVEPALFTANASGTGTPAAILYRVRNGNLTTESVNTPIDFGPEGDVLVLVLYGEGIRKRTSLSAVTMKIGGISVAAEFADAAPGFIGLDQINTAVLPRTLAGKGLVNLELTVDGKPANVVTLNFK